MINLIIDIIDIIAWTWNQLKTTALWRIFKVRPVTCFFTVWSIQVRHLWLRTPTNFVTNNYYLVRSLSNIFQLSQCTSKLIFSFRSYLPNSVKNSIKQPAKVFCGRYSQDGSMFMSASQGEVAELWLGRYSGIWGITPFHSFYLYKCFKVFFIWHFKITRYVYMTQQQTNCDCFKRF